MTGVAEVDQCALDAVDAFLYGHFGKADEYGFWQTGRYIHFGFDGSGVDADEGEGVELGEHRRNS